MLGGCERGCGNDRAHAGVGFGSLSIQFEGKKEVNAHHAGLLVKFIKFVESTLRQCKSFIRAYSSNSSNSLNYTGRLATVLSSSFHHHYALALSVSEKNRSLW
jgi:hypothetical protein